MYALTWLAATLQAEEIFLKQMHHSTRAVVLPETAVESDLSIHQVSISIAHAAWLSHVLD